MNVRSEIAPASVADEKAAMGSIRFVFLGVLVSLILAAVLVPSTGSARADAIPNTGTACADAQMRLDCSFCHAKPELSASPNDIEQKVKSARGVPRFEIHAGLEFAALALDLLGALFMLIVVVFALLRWASYALKCASYALKSSFHLPKRQVQPLHQRPFLDWFLRGLNVLIAGEIIGSVSTTINASWKRIAVLLSVVTIRVLIGLILQMERSVSHR